MAQCPFGDGVVRKVQPAVITEGRHQHLAHGHIIGGQSAPPTVLAGQEAEAGTAIAVKSLAWARAE
ncbi:MAG: hypothetical protein WB902_05210 [Acetobacteraceae bacterium]